MSDNNPNLENEIKILEQKLAEKRNQLTEESSVEVKSIVKESVKERLDEVAKSNSLEKNLVQTQPNDVPSKVRNLTKDGQVDFLVKMVFSKSIGDAISLAQKLDSPYVLDEFHDVLFNKFYEELVKRGKI